ncbi:MAG TPA: transglutaminase family protein, partial [Candidatus Synoicihabitans sp.]|nr:transglutaminase family protein [Candidatus Synoicihabitans sp.]
MCASPYDDSTWAAIQACGDAVEAVLTRSGVQLTMGGEPTFVPFEPTGAEWATAALGPTKLGYARRFARQLVASAYSGAAIFETAGKHYPGEPLPRWAVLIQWLADGPPLWRDAARLKSDLTPGSHTRDDAQRTITRLATALGVTGSTIAPLADSNSLEQVLGYVLPLDHDGHTWRTEDWSPDIGRGTIELLYGDSYAGLRLPLARLAEGRLKRALTIEISAGSLTIFIPPLLLEAYVNLLGHLEHVLTELDLRECVLAGYAPPPDPRLPTIGLASDPGVIEVNLAVCATWADYDRQLNLLYAIARETGLCARKLHFNGRVTGTGGGAHLVFGGPQGLLSPFFAFPALLPSLIRYFQHHPSLSYVFTGQYLGPSSQAPRIDESTFEALYELEIACAGAERFGSPANLPLFDLLFRDLLMDRSGNTHRAEISVDKLWNPFAGNGRLGLVELRAFETHPDAAALSLTGLFVRAIFARLCADPLQAPFIRWAGELHDRFFLPAFIWQDLTTIVDDLRTHGIPFDMEWLRPLWEWRFPKLGEFTLEVPAGEKDQRAMRVEFRQALEAWPLLGESPNAGTVSRTVDSGMDRLEASVSGPALREGGVLLVNGLPCEFRVAGDTAACGIRYRAFYLTPALHPHVPVHAPLLIEWLDRATLTVVAAARWHVWNHSGEPYPDRPKDEAEALARAA